MFDAHLAKIGLGKFGFECCPPRRAHRVAFEILNQIIRIFGRIASLGSRPGERRARERFNNGTGLPVKCC